MQTKFNFLYSISLLLVIFITGCGISSTEFGSTKGTIGDLVFQGQFVDGPITNGLVSLATLKKGRISREFSTDANGRFEMRLTKSELLALDDKDLPYIFARSTASSTIAGTNRNLRAGQATFKSILKVSDLKAIAGTSRGELDTSATFTDPSLKNLSQGLKVSHYSAAKAALIESKLKATGKLKKSNASLNPDVYNDEADPTISYSDSDLDEILNHVETVEEALQDKDSDESKKFVMLAAATKYVVERVNSATVEIQDGEIENVDDLDELLLELAEESAVLDAAVVNTIQNSILQEINRELAGLDGDFGSAALDFASNLANEIDINEIQQAAQTDFTRIRESIAKAVYNYKKVGSNSNTIHLTYTGLTNSAQVMMKVQQNYGSANGGLGTETSRLILRFYDPTNANRAIEFFKTTTNAADVRLIKVGSTNVHLPLTSVIFNPAQSIFYTGLNTPHPGSTINVSGSNLTLGNTFHSSFARSLLQLPPAELPNSSIFSGLEGTRFLPVTVTAGATVELVFGWRRSESGIFFPLGVVAFRGLAGDSQWYVLSQANIDGARFPVINSGSADIGRLQEAINDVNQETSQGLASFLKISSELRSSNNQTAAMRANLTWAFANLANHLDKNEDPGTTLGSLLQKLNVSSSKRSIFDFGAMLTRALDGSLVLGDIQGFVDIQNYFDNSSAGLIAVVDQSISAINSSLQIAGNLNLSSNAEVLDWAWNDSVTSIQKKDLHAIKGMMYTLKFILHYLSLHNLDLSNNAIAAVKQRRSITTNVSSMKEVIQYSGKDDVSQAEKDSYKNLRLIDLLNEDPNFLTQRAVSTATLISSLQTGLEETLIFIELIQNLNGGDRNSAFFVPSNELEDLRETKRIILGAWNNLSGEYHPSVQISGVSGAGWYLIPEEAGLTTLKTVNHSLGSQQSGFNFEYLYSSSKSQSHNFLNPQNPVSITKTRAFIRASLRNFLSANLRSLLLNNGSIQTSALSSDGELARAHIANQQPSSAVSSILPGATVYKFSGQDYINPQMAEFFQGTVTNQPYSLNLATLPPSFISGWSPQNTRIFLTTNGPEDVVFEIAAPDSPVGQVLSSNLNSPNPFGYAFIVQTIGSSQSLARCSSPGTGVFGNCFALSSDPTIGPAFQNLTP